MNTTLTLTHVVKVYIPQSVGAKYLDKVLAKLAGDFGGATSLEVRGSYLTLDGALVIEDLWQVYAFTGDQVNPEYFSDVVSDLTSHGEETVGIEIDGAFYLAQ